MSLKPRIVIGASRPDNPAWESNIIPHAAEIHAAVLYGPNSGKWTTFDPAYGALCARLRSVNVKPLGYIFSKYAKRPMLEIVGDINSWNQLYGAPTGAGGARLIEGFFVDETATSAALLDYYRELSRHIDATQAIIFNCGRPPESVVVSLRGSFCISERSQTNVLNEAYPAYVKQWPAEKWLVIASNIKVSDAPKVVAKIKASGVLFYCLSGATGDEPEYGVETEIFLSPPAPTPVPTPTPDPNNVYLVALCRGLMRTLKMSEDSTIQDIPWAVEVAMKKIEALEAGFKNLPNAQVVAEVARRLP